MSTGVRLENRLVFVPLLVDKSLDVKFEVPGMNEVLSNFKRNNINLLDETYESKNHETISGHVVWHRFNPVFAFCIIYQSIKWLFFCSLTTK